MEENNITQNDKFEYDAHDIAQDLDSGMRVFIYRPTGKLIVAPSEEHLDYIDEDDDEMWGEELELLNNEPEHCYEIEKWSSSDDYDLMREFAENHVPDKFTQNKLIDALDNKKPFRNFGFVIDRAGELRDKWFEFRDAWHDAYVARQLETYHETDFIKSKK